MTNRETYEARRTSDLRHYLGQRGLGIKPIDVEARIGKRVSVHTLTRPELIDLLCRLDEAGEGLIEYLRPAG